MKIGLLLRYLIRLFLGFLGWEVNFSSARSLSFGLTINNSSLYGEIGGSPVVDILPTVPVSIEAITIWISTQTGSVLSGVQAHVKYPNGTIKINTEHGGIGETISNTFQPTSKITQIDLILLKPSFVIVSGIRFHTADGAITPWYGNCNGTASYVMVIPKNVSLVGFAGYAGAQIDGIVFQLMSVTCSSNADCPTLTPLCALGVCISCESNSECIVLQPEFPICINGRCHSGIACANSSLCTLSSPACYQGKCYPCNRNNECLNPGASKCGPDHTCVPCSQNKDCLYQSGLPFCLNGVCVQCLSDVECPLSKAVCQCNSCAGCQSNGDCVNHVGTNNCSSTQNGCLPSSQTCPCSSNFLCYGTKCIPCLNNLECTPPTPVCGVSTFNPPVNPGCVPCVSNSECDPPLYCAQTECVQCLTNDECSGTTPICNNNFICVPCSTNDECNSPLVCAAPSCVQCKNNQECSGDTPICSLSTNTCVICVQNSECSPLVCSSPYCVQCNNNTECSGITPYCNSSHICTSCRSNSECTSPLVCIFPSCFECKTNAECSENKPYCNPQSYTCQPCTNNSNCNSPLICKAPQCVQCVSNAECSGNTPHCNTTSNICVACSTNTDCTSPYVCAAPYCVQCKTNSECSQTLPVCNQTQNLCSPCQQNSDCKVPLVCATPACVQCKTNAECSGSTPYCNPTSNTCHPCSLNSECPSPLVCADPICVQCKTNAECSSLKPFCDSNICVQCLSNSDCLNHTLPRCLQGFCSGCLSNSDCLNFVSQYSYCHNSTGECVQCLNSLECPTIQNPICSVNYSCTSCEKDSECARFENYPYCISSICSQCRNTSDCLTIAAPSCDLRTSICVNCEQNSDCSRLNSELVCYQGICLEPYVYPSSNLFSPATLMNQISGEIQIIGSPPVQSGLARGIDKTLFDIIILISFFILGNTVVKIPILWKQFKTRIDALGNLFNSRTLEKRSTLRDVYDIYSGVMNCLFWFLIPVLQCINNFCTDVITDVLPIVLLVPALAIFERIPYPKQKKQLKLNVIEKSMGKEPIKILRAFIYGVIYMLPLSFLTLQAKGGSGDFKSELLSNFSMFFTTLILGSTVSGLEALVLWSILKCGGSKGKYYIVVGKKEYCLDHRTSFTEFAHNLLLKGSTEIVDGKLISTPEGFAVVPQSVDGISFGWSLEKRQGTIQLEYDENKKLKLRNTDGTIHDLLIYGLKAELRTETSPKISLIVSDMECVLAAKSRWSFSSKTISNPNRHTFDRYLNKVKIISNQAILYIFSKNSEIVLGNSRPALSLRQKNKSQRKLRKEIGDQQIDYKAFIYTLSIHQPKVQLYCL